VSLEGEALLAAFGLPRWRYVHLIGAGGKTSLMFALARALVQAEQRVLCTTSTRIMPPRPDQAPRLLIEDDPAQLLAALASAKEAHCTVAAARKGAKLLGYEPEILDALHAADPQRCMLVEADGAAGRPLKAHAPWEPALSPQAQLVIAVLGARGLGGRLQQEVHRPALAVARLGLLPDQAVTPAHAARLFFHPQGYLRALPPTAELRVFISQVRTRGQQDAAQRLAAALRAMDQAGRIRAIVSGDLSDTCSTT